MTLPDSEMYPKILFNTVKPKVFISYHHDNDQWQYNKFTQLFNQMYDIITDTSVDRIIDSGNSEYQMRRIREDYITGSSVTIVLCGRESYKRKFIDWEICATLNKQHGLLGIKLPDNPIDKSGYYIVPARLYDNIKSGYAHFILWTDNPAELIVAVRSAKELSNKTSLVDNTRDLMRKNLT